MEDWPIVNWRCDVDIDEAFAKRWHDLRQQGIGAIAHYRQGQEARLLLDDRSTLRGIALCSMLNSLLQLTSRWRFCRREMSKTAAIQTLKRSPPIPSPALARVMHDVQAGVMLLSGTGSVRFAEAEWGRPPGEGLVPFAAIIIRFMRQS
jgi:hypothetical protein